MNLLEGKEIKLKILNDLKEELLKINERIKLVVIQVGNDEASSVYLKQKEKMANDLNYGFEHLKFDENITEQELINIIHNLNENEKITGIMVQMPLPKHINPKKVQNAVIPYKDVDGLCDYNAGLLMHGNNDAIVPCTVRGIVDMLDYYNIDIEGKNVVIVGRSDLVGKPLAALLTNRNATVTLCHSKTINLKEHTSRADILIVSVGKHGLIKGEDIKEGAVVIDVGINILNGKIVGDVDFETAKYVASYITPVPGGVGQLTVANLAKNTYKSYKLKLNK